MATQSLVRSRYAQRVRFFSRILGESRTQGSHAESADVNYIVNRFQRTGELPKNPRGLEPQFMDVSAMQVDLTTAYNNAIEAVGRFHDAEDAYKAHQAEEAEKASEPEPPAAPGASPPADTPPTSPAPGADGG